MIDPQRLLRAVGLFGLLVAVYFLMYSGQVVSTDEQVLFDGAHSLFQNGTLELAYTSNLRPYSTQPGTLPVGTYALMARVGDKNIFYVKP